MEYLHDQGFKVIPVRDLATCLDWRQKPDNPWEIIERRKSRLRVLMGNRIPYSAQDE